MKLWQLARLDLLRCRRRHVVSLSAVVSTVSSLLIIFSLFFGIRKHVLQPILPELPLNLLLAEPKNMSLGFFAFDARTFRKNFNDDTLKAIRKTEGVEAVYPIIGAQFPMRAEGGEAFLGHRMRTDVFATGLSSELVKTDVADGYAFEDAKGPRVPVLVARRLLDLYNSTVAKSINKPKLSEEAIVGLEFELVLGSSYARGTPRPDRVSRKTAQIVGLSEKASLVGISVPEQTMRRWNKSMSTAAPEFSGAYVKLNDRSYAGAVVHTLEQLGLSVDGTAKVASSLYTTLAVLTACLVGLILFFSGLAIMQSFAQLIFERRTEFAIMRALGATQARITKLVLLEALMIACVGIALGAPLGVGLSYLLDIAVVSLISDIPLKPTHVLHCSFAAFAGASFLGIVAALTGALYPTLRGAQKTLSTSLRL